MGEGVKGGEGSSQAGKFAQQVHAHGAAAGSGLGASTVSLSLEVQQPIQTVGLGNGQGLFQLVSTRAASNVCARGLRLAFEKCAVKGCSGAAAYYRAGSKRGGRHAAARAHAAARTARRRRGTKLSLGTRHLSRGPP